MAQATKAARMIEWFARLGHGAKGMVYLLVGYRALQGALRWMRPVGSSEALKALHKQPLGDPLLLILAAGLAFFALWRAFQTFWDPDGVGKSWKGLLERAGFALSGLFYGNLAAGALEMALEEVEPEDVHEQEQLAAFLLGQPLGQGLVALAGLTVIATGLGQLYKAWSGKFLEPLHVGEMRPWERRLMVGLAYAGLSARGCVFLALGAFVIRAAWTLNPKEVESVQEIFITLRRLPYGSALLAMVGIGFIAYGLFMGVEARYRRLNR
ncbi:hypothetical protein ABS71_16730 [bacterium SCN 62-11]|nr:MAG: hypothetical protein ABS71_16730 [bacterium SCN 62-11]